MIGRIKEGTFLEVEASFYDSDEVEALPGTIRYQTNCLTNKQVVRDWTDVPIDTTVAITVPATDNVIIDNKNERERRQLVVQTNHGTDNQVTETITWLIDNIRGS
jgi:hypothetical protein